MSFESAIADKFARLESDIKQGNIVPATVAAVDQAHMSGSFSNPVQIEFTSGTTLWVGVDGFGMLPPVGSQVEVLFNGAAPVLLPRPGTLIEGGLFSSNFPGFGQGGPGWGIDYEGNVEVNDATIRGDLTFQPDELLSNGNFDTTIDPWTDDGVANVDVTRDVPPGGGFAALVQQTVAGAGPAPMAHPALPVEEGRTYRLEASIYPSIVFAPFLISRVTLRLRWLDAAAAVISESSVTPTLLPGAWNDRVAFAARAPADAVELEPLFVATFDKAHPTEGPAAYVDQISLVEASRAERGHLEDCTASALDVDGDLRVGGKLSASRIGCQLLRANTQTVTNNSHDTITWDTEFDGDPNGFIAVPGTTLTIPPGLDGLYAITLRVAWSADPTTNGYIGFTAGGIRYNNAPSFFAGIFGGVCAATIPLVAGNTITCEVYQLSGSNKTITGHLFAHRIGA